MKKPLSFVFTILVMFSLILAACSSSGEVSKNENEQDSKGSSNGNPDKTSLDIYSFGQGTSTFVFGVALAKAINENSDWLSAQSLESPNPGALAQRIIDDPSMKTNTIGFFRPEEAKVGAPPFKEPYGDLKGIAAFGQVGNGFVSIDDDIKSVEDFEGKRIGVGTQPSLMRADFPIKVVEEMGVKNVKWEYMGMPQLHQALANGVIDAAWSAASAINPELTKWNLIPPMIEVSSQHDVNFISIDKDATQKVLEDYGIDGPSYPFEIPVGAVGDIQKEPWTVVSDLTKWAADESISDEIVTEFLTIMADNHKIFAESHPQGAFITPETMAEMGLDEDMIHPAALKFYKDRGLMK